GAGEHRPDHPGGRRGVRRHRATARARPRWQVRSPAGADAAGRRHHARHRSHHRAARYGSSRDLGGVFVSCGGAVAANGRVPACDRNPARPACRCVAVVLSGAVSETFHVKSPEPMFNVPPVVMGTIAAFVFVQLGRQFLLSPDDDIDFLLWFSFIPARYASALQPSVVLPGGLTADLWTFVTYALIHGNWVHLAVNSVWLLPFGTVVARRFGGSRYLLFFVITAAAGAAAHLLTNWGAILPMVGASAAVSGFMAAATRF